MTHDHPLQILIVESRFYEAISDELLAGAKQALEKFHIKYDVLSVPGAFEVPAAISMANQARHKPAGRDYDGYVALGCVIRGETTHYDYVCQESARALMDLTVQERLAIGYGILTVENEAQAWARANRHEGDRGGNAAKVCLGMIGVHRNLLEGKSQHG